MNKLSKFSLSTMSVLALTPVMVSPITSIASAKSTVHNHKHVRKSFTGVNSAWAKQLAKEGYVFRVQNHGKQLKHYQDVMFQVSPKAVRNFAVKKTNFKVVNAYTNHGTPTLVLVAKHQRAQYRVVMGDGGLSSGVYNQQATLKGLQPLVKLELKLKNRPNGHMTHADMQKLTKMVNRLHGHNRQVAQKSVQQLNKYLKTHNLSDYPVLLLGLGL
jgi:hypothetical protein